MFFISDFDCILTNINMERIEKGKYNLPKEELERTENILKRALAVENGDAAPSLTEEHPDGCKFFVIFCFFSYLLC